MKKCLIIFIFVLFATQTFSQLTFYTINRGDTELHSIPRLSYDIGIPVNIIGPWSIIKSQVVFMESGFFITNNGIIYDEDQYRHLHRVIGVNFPLRVGVIVKKKFYFGTGINYNFNLHYKYKTFDAGGRKNKYVVASEFFSDRVNFFYPSAEISAGISLHGLGRFTLRFQTFPISLLNPIYTETVRGYEVKPFEDISALPFRFILSYSSGL